MRLFHQGDRGAAVRDVQDRLARLDHPFHPDVPGEFGEGTFTAVSRFQNERGLPVDGIVGPETGPDASSPQEHLVSGILR